MNKPSCDRRDFLNGLIATTGLLGLGGLSLEERVAYGLNNKDKEYQDRYYVFLFMNGGWDILLTLDPRDPTVFTEAQVPNTLIQTGYAQTPFPNGASPLVDTSLGPLGYFMGDALKHTDKFSIIRGLSMDTLGHVDSFQRLVTGKTPVGSRFRGSSFDVWTASLLGEQNPVPNLSLSLGTANLDQPGYASALRVGHPAQVYGALSRTTPFSKTQEAALNAFFKNSQACPSTSSSNFLTKAAASQQSISTVLSKDLADSFNLGATTKEIQDLKQKYMTNNEFNLPMQTVAIAAQALKTGLSRAVTGFLMIGNTLDTHDNLQTNGPDQMLGFNAYAHLIDDLSKSQYKDTDDSWLDRTTVILASEFSRYPLISALGGREHWLLNSVAIAGGDIKPGMVVGGSSDLGMMPLATNLATGKPDPENGEILKPEHIYRTLLTGIGVTDDVADLRVEPITALLK